jgi:3-hydroxybutyryl-CoA dehydrogenase
MRTVAMLMNAAYEAALQRVACREAIDRAMRPGVNYPGGPFEWAQKVGWSVFRTALHTLLTATGDPATAPRPGCACEVHDTQLR